MKYFLGGVEVTNSNFTHGSVQYPSNWCALSSKAEKDAIGIVGVDEVYPPLGPFEYYGPYSDSAMVNQIVTRTYSVLREPIETIKATKAQEIKGIRDFKKNNAGYVVGANRFHSDADSRIQQLGLVMFGANLPAGIMWKTMAGDFVPMTQTLAGQIFQAAAAADMALFAACESKIAAVNASATPETYDVNAGWPA